MISADKLVVQGKQYISDDIYQLCNYVDYWLLIWITKAAGEDEEKEEVVSARIGQPRKKSNGIEKWASSATTTREGKVVPQSVRILL